MWTATWGISELGSTSKEWIQVLHRPETSVRILETPLAPLMKDKIYQLARILLGCNQTRQCYVILWGRFVMCFLFVPSILGMWKWLGRLWRKKNTYTSYVGTITIFPSLNHRFSTWPISGSLKNISGRRIPVPFLGCYLPYVPQIHPNIWAIPWSSRSNALLERCFGPNKSTTKSAVAAYRGILPMIYRGIPINQPV